MKRKRKSIIAALALTAALTATVCFSGCTPEFYSIAKLDGYVSAAEVESNGGFVAEKGEYVYFINGRESYTADNTFGVTKSALMRIKRTDLTEKKYDKAETVVPLLFAAQNVEHGGVYIYGDYVYFATPTTDKDKYGNVQNTSLDFKRAKLDGTETMGGYYFRCTDNSTQYRFVEKDGTVYCLYTEDGELKSFNTATGDKKVLVKGASAYYFDETDKENGTVYYVMSVTDKQDSKDPQSFGYNQLYSVTPDAYASTNADAGSYTVSNAAGENYRTYDYDKSYLEENLDGFDAGNYTTYPYVNLGQLVLDGIGSSDQLCAFTQYNDEEAIPTGYTEVLGYVYAVKSYQNGGVYLTRTKVQGSQEEGKIYYLDESKTEAAGWNTIGGNFAENLHVVLDDTTLDTTGGAIYTYDEATATHEYFYVNGSNLCKGKTTVSAGVSTQAEPIVMSYAATNATLLFLRGDYLYYYAENSSNLSRINYTGATQSVYDWNEYQGGEVAEEYKVSTFTQMQFNTGWYAPEFVEGTNVLLYANSKAVGGVVYNYITALDLTSADGDMMTAAEVNDVSEKYDEVTGYMSDSTDVSDATIRTALKYVFEAGTTKAFDDVEDLYADYQVEEVRAFVGHRKSTNKSANDYTDKFKDESGNFYDRETYFVNMIGKMTDSDVDQYADNLASGLMQRTTTEDEETFPVWAIVLISVGGALLVAAGITIPLVLVHKKKKKERADREATAVRKRKKIDTTDDKTIDVYGDEEKAATEEAEPVEENAVEVEAEPVEAEAEETADETEKTE